MPIHNIQTITYQPLLPQSPKIDNKPKIKVVEKKQATQSTIEKHNKEIVLDSKITNDNYIELFYKQILARDCVSIYYKSRNKNDEIDFTKEFKQNIKRMSYERQSEVTQSQLESYEKFIESCQNLKKEVLAASNKNEKLLQAQVYSISSSIKDIMLKTKAKTDEEIILKQAKADIANFTKQLDVLFELKKGSNTLSPEQLTEISNESSILQQQMRELREEYELYYETPEYQDLLIQIKDNENRERNSKNIDQSQIELQIDIINELIQKLQIQLNTQYASVFYALFSSLNFNEGFTGVLSFNLLYGSSAHTNIDIVPINQITFKDLNIKNSQYYNTIIDSALQLYLCYLGEDCSIDSRWIRAFCIGQQSFDSRKNKVYFQACETNLEEFYFKSFLSYNQIQDVNVIFNYLVNKYAK